MWQHALYTSKKVLSIWLYLRRKFLVISILSFIHSVQDNLYQVFIEPIGFIVESILKDVILWRCCGLVFCVKCKVSSKRVRILIIHDFWATYWKCFSILFLECFGYFQHKVDTEFICDPVNNIAFTTFTSVCTNTDYFCSQVAVALYINKIFRY